MRRTGLIWFLAVAAMLTTTSVASGYYYWVHFTSPFGPYSPVPEKFDVSALNNKTISYFISDVGPSQLATGDTLAGLISEIRLAAKTWNDVTTSDLRVAFGGISPSGTNQSTPGIDVVFNDDIPPGIIDLAGITAVDNRVATAADGSKFVPVTRSIIQFRRDLRDLPSFGERSFVNMVHEFGHALGLQHSFSSGAMSTEWTRATTKAAPLGADDRAGISILYPTADSFAHTASVSGRVTMNGAGVNLASVAAISPNGPAVNTLTNPDGTYTLQGIPEGGYYVYVHTLPPSLQGEAYPANIHPPRDSNGNDLPYTGPFETQLYPGTRDPNQATMLFLAARDARSGIDFAVQKRTSVPVSTVVVYGYYGQNALHPAPLYGAGTAVTVVAAGVGLLSGSTPAAGLNISVLGQSGATVVNGTVKSYIPDQYIQFGVAPTFGWSPGPRHLLFATPSDLYVLPGGLMMVAFGPPTISQVTTSVDDKGKRAALVTGVGFDPGVRILFDGAEASILRRNDDGSLLVSLPSANGGHRANVVALNSDGQSSLFLQSGNVPVYSYDASDAPAINLSISGLPAGAEAMIEINGVNTNFVEGQTMLAFGSSDIVVRRLWVLSPTKLWANVSVSPSAQAITTHVTVATGLQIAAQQYAFQTLAPNATQVKMIPPVVNAMTNALGAPAGRLAMVNVANLTASSGLTMTVGDQPAQILAVGNGQITFQVPAGLAVGPAVVKLQTQSGDAVYPIVMTVTPTPPTVTAAYSAPGVYADVTHPAHPGQNLWLSVTGLPDPATITLDSVMVTIAGIVHTPASMTSAGGSTLIQLLMNNMIPADDQTSVTVTYNAATSQSVAIPVR